MVDLCPVISHQCLISFALISSHKEKEQFSVYAFLINLYMHEFLLYYLVSNFELTLSYKYYPTDLAIVGFFSI